MNSRHRQTLVDVFADPVSPTLKWVDIEALLLAAGCRLVQNAGSRVRFEHNGIKAISGSRRTSRPDRIRHPFMNAVIYKGYAARIDFDAEDGLLVGRIAGINDVVGFHAETVEHIVKAFHEAVDDYIATCEAVGKPAEKPYSGKLMLRV